jgi:hypothetical protein
VFKTAGPLPNASVRYNAAPTQSLLTVLHDPERASGTLVNDEDGMTPNNDPDSSRNSRVDATRDSELSQDRRSQQQRHAQGLTMPWWLDTSWSGRWSVEETQLRTRILGIALATFLPIFYAVTFSLDAFGVEPHVGALIAFFLVGASALYSGRRICARRWPDLVKTADKNALKRLAPRT